MLDVVTGEALPFAEGGFDTATALFGLPRWSDVRAGLRELRRARPAP
ncbi:class I SAM-dependent methyltransferase [Streptomyces sp. NPDC047718]